MKQQYTTAAMLGDQPTTYKIGRLEYDITENRVSVDGETIGLMPQIAAQMGKLIISYPQPLTAHHMETIAGIVADLNGEARTSISILEEELLKNSRRLAKTLGYKPITLNEAQDCFYLISHLDDLTNEQREQMNLRTFGNIAVCPDRLCVWIDNKVSENSFTHTQTALLAFLLNPDNRGRVVSRPELEKSGVSDNTQTLTKLSTKLQAMTGEEYIGARFERGVGYIFYTNRQELENVLPSRKRQPSTPPPMPWDDGITHAPQFL